MSTSHAFAESRNRPRVNFTSWWTVSNLLSFSRMLLLIPIILFLRRNHVTDNFIALGFMLLAAATDWFDGFLARRFHQQSDLGRILDPLSDKICIGGVALYLTFYRDFPLWFLILILARDFTILIVGLFIATRQGIPESNWPGKIAVTAMAIVLILFAMDIEPVKWPFFWIMVVLFFVSIVSYVQRAIQVVKLKNRQKLQTE
ncbi:MAG: CDP-alcohol phosphatidyltransferase family protein [candidate division KSB1 bacterium]|nr:CDP-alcohol phosphatidyltransferase family protein [candidate division KSB1 bacterium]MDZ7303552.1 CDP-alcohol phosphatidyltransferase family protein [candidate division KSB1 bacterium]MDZ7312795.1 CDP-alcohol phosphatidyltransferase family protein [candidate division KSB1 bacterium]